MTFKVDVREINTKVEIHGLRITLTEEFSTFLHVNDHSVLTINIPPT